MMKICICILSFSSCVAVSAQLLNEGATLVIETNALLKIEGDVSNVNAGIITVLGVLEVEGDLTNSATLITGANSTIRFSGISPSAFTSGSATIYHMQINKSGNATLNLADDLTVTNEFEFTSGKVILGDHNLHLGASTAISNPGTNAYIAANGVGSVHKALNGNGTVYMPIGDADDYSPITMGVEGSGFASAQIITRVVTSTHPEKPSDAESYITRYWEVEASGITGYSNEWSGTYVAGDLQGNSGLIRGAVYNGTQWDYYDATGNVNTVSGSTVDGMADLTGTNFYGKADIRVFLQGAYNSSTGMMTTTLNSMGLIPLTSPYSDAPVTVSSIPADVTDWIKLEMRSKADPSQVLGRVSAFLRNDGTIISATGGLLPQVKDSDGSSIVSVHHRNHLPIRTDIPLNTMEPSVYHFTTGQSQAFQNPSITSNDAMMFVSGTFPVYAMWAGNSNNNNTIRYTGPGNDNNVLLNTVLNGNKSMIINNIYSDVDFNLNGNVRYTGPSNDNNALLNISLAGNKSSIVTRHF